MVDKRIEVKQVVSTLRILKDTCNVVFAENQNLNKQNKELRTECDRLRNGANTATIDNDDLFDAMSEIIVDVKKWRSTKFVDTSKVEKQREKTKTTERRTIA